VIDQYGSKNTKLVLDLGGLTDPHDRLATQKAWALLHVMNLSGYDAMAGMPQDMKVIKDVKRDYGLEPSFPILSSSSANDPQGSSHKNKSVIIKQGVRFGVFQLRAQPNGVGSQQNNINIKNEIESLTQNSDIQIVLAHCTYHTAKKIFENSQEIDVMVTRNVFFPPLIKSNRIIVPVSQNGERIELIRIETTPQKSICDLQHRSIPLNGSRPESQEADNFLKEHYKPEVSLISQ
jgi:2',3'-cyclic-nucleotide 2'-phosphodiesterase (5'-nucleotidase family)